MEDWQIRQLALEFRLAIETARREKMLKSAPFSRFPNGCCGESCYYLGEYLKENGISTVRCSYKREDYSHAWLIVNDGRINPSTTFSCILPEDVEWALEEYGMEPFGNVFKNTRYEENNIQDGLIVDITADQFDDYNIKVYVGYMDEFHSGFDFVWARDFDDENLDKDTYQRIKSCLKMGKENIIHRD